MDYGTISKSYVSAMDTMLDTREINSQVTDIYNEDALTDMLGWADRKKPLSTGQTVYYTFVNEALFQQVIPDTGGVSGSGTATLTLVLTAGTSGKTKKQDIIKFVNNKNGIVYNVVTSSGIDTLTVKSVDGSNLTCTAADKLAIISVAMGEKSSAGKAARYGWTKYSNKVQIFNEVSDITDVQGAATLTVSVGGSNKFMMKDHLEKKLLLKGKINAAFIGGIMSTSSFSDASPALTDQNSGGLGVQTTRGIDDSINLYGAKLDASGSAYALTALDNVCDTLTAARAPLDYLVVSGKKASRSKDVVFKNLGSSGVTSVRLVVDSKEVDLTVSKITYGGYNFNYATMPILDHPTLFSQTVIAKSQYYIPYNSQVKVQGGGTQPAIQVRYIPSQSPFGNDMIGESYDGALAIPNPHGTEQKWLTSWVTTQGLEVLGAQHFLREQVLA